MTSLSKTRLREVKILCFHGFQQNAESLKKKIESSWCKGALKDLWEFVYVNAPFDCRDSLRLSGATKREPREGGLQWWSFPLDLDSVDLSPQFVRDTLQESLTVFDLEVEKHKPDGILGFSQGGALVATWLQTRSELPEWDLVKPKFAFIVSGYDEREGISYDDVDIPTLHIFGARDTDVPPEHSRSLATKFPKAKTIFHEQSHVIPSASKTRAELLTAWTEWLAPENSPKGRT